MFVLTEKPSGIHRSATMLKRLTVKTNNTDHLAAGKSWISHDSSFSEIFICLIVGSFFYFLCSLCPSTPDEPFCLLCLHSGSEAEALVGGL